MGGWTPLGPKIQVFWFRMVTITEVIRGTQRDLVTTNTCPSMTSFKVTVFGGIGSDLGSDLGDLVKSHFMCENTESEVNTCAHGAQFVNGSAKLEPRGSL